MINTSYYAKQKELLKLNRELVSISNSTPDWFIGSKYYDLIPTADLVWEHKSGKLITKDFVTTYYKQLQKLDKDKVIQELDNKILMCYCGPGKFCHRHVVAYWLCLDEVKQDIEIHF